MKQMYHYEAVVYFTNGFISIDMLHILFFVYSCLYNVRVFASSLHFIVKNSFPHIKHNRWSTLRYIDNAIGLSLAIGLLFNLYRSIFFSFCFVAPLILYSYPYFSIFRSLPLSLVYPTLDVFIQSYAFQTGALVCTTTINQFKRHI